jgi:diguanylate cyclase (GGDEF)-like protein/PAS domain S-box-containing protein
MDQLVSCYENLLDNLFEGLYFVDATRTIIRWNKAAENLTGFTSAEMLGKHCSDNLLNHVDQNGRQLCLSHCPLVKVMEEGVPLQQDVFLHHKSGHRLPVRVRINPLCDSQGKVVGAAELFSDLSEASGVMKQMEDLKRQALTDSLTGLPNRACLEGELERCLDEYKRYGWNVGLLFLDVDHFKAVNDTYGHDRGDDVLRLVATTLAQNCRASDIVGRWGGEEFVGLVRNANPKNLLQISERNRMLVEQSFILVDGRPLNVTISLGAVLARPGESADSLVRRADQLMFESKNKGRNCVSSDV